MNALSLILATIEPDDATSSKAIHTKMLRDLRSIFGYSPVVRREENTVTYSFGDLIERTVILTVSSRLTETASSLVAVLSVFDVVVTDHIRIRKGPAIFEEDGEVYQNYFDSVVYQYKVIIKSIRALAKAVSTGDFRRAIKILPSTGYPDTKVRDTLADYRRLNKKTLNKLILGRQIKNLHIPKEQDTGGASIEDWFNDPNTFSLKQQKRRTGHVEATVEPTPVHEHQRYVSLLTKILGKPSSVEHDNRYNAHDYQWHPLRVDDPSLFAYFGAYFLDGTHSGGRRDAGEVVINAGILNVGLLEAALYYDKKSTAEIQAEIVKLVGVFKTELTKVPVYARRILDGDTNGVAAEIRRHGLKREVGTPTSCRYLLQQRTKNTLEQLARVSVTATVEPQAKSRLQAEIRKWASKLGCRKINFNNAEDHEGNEAFASFEPVPLIEFVVLEDDDQDEEFEDTYLVEMIVWGNAVQFSTFYQRGTLFPTTTEHDVLAGYNGFKAASIEASKKLATGRPGAKKEAAQILADAERQYVHEYAGVEVWLEHVNSVCQHERQKLERLAAQA